LHILLIHQAFAALDEPGGTRHHELARYLADQSHHVTVIASPVSYLTGKNTGNINRVGVGSEPVPTQTAHISDNSPKGEVTILRAYTYPALHRSFVHRVFSFISFMASSFWIGLKVRQVDLVWGTSPPIFQGLTACGRRSPSRWACCTTRCWCGLRCGWNVSCTAAPIK
jgi:hypothetical protein